MFKDNTQYRISTFSVAIFIALFMVTVSKNTENIIMTSHPSLRSRSYPWLHHGNKIKHLQGHYEHGLAETRFCGSQDVHQICD